MSGENKDVQQPNFEGEEMKLPENTDAQPVVAEKSEIVNAPLLAALGLLLALILGGMYWWFNSLVVEPTVTEPALRPTAEENNEPESTTAEAQAEMMQATSPSDEVSALEADISATDLDGLDAEMNAIDAELDAALNIQ